MGVVSAGAKTALNASQTQKTDSLSEAGFWWALRDSNLRPLACEASALNR